MKYLRNQAGVILPFIITVVVVLMALGVSLAAIAVSNIRAASAGQRSGEALNIAEAGLNYYLWHLAHNTTDYQDGGSGGTAPFGPYTHNYFNQAGKKIGTFTLTITPPSSGSTVTTVKSVGQSVGATGKRTLQAQLGIPSFASYALLTGTEVWFGPGENAVGPVHSNVGVHMDGTNNGPVTSANASYVPGASFGSNGVTVHNGVWGNGGPSSQWQFPVPTVNFGQVTADLSALKTAATANGVYLGVVNAAFSTNRGYQITLKNNKSFDIAKVNNTDGNGDPTGTTFVRNQAIPANGLLYVEDNVWVSGNWNGRLTIASGRLPDVSGTNTSITITANTSYTALNGSVALGLIAQKDIAVALGAPNNLTIDAALLAQKGHVWFPNYAGNNVKGTLTFFGAIASFDYWTWSWVSGGGTLTDGYGTNNNTFDTNLTFSPPPNYPTTGAYTILNWRELLNGP